MKKLILITLLLAVIGLSHSEAQTKNGDKKVNIAMKLDSLDYLRELLVEEEIKLNHEMFRIFLDEIDFNIRMPFYSYMNNIDVSNLKNDTMKKLYEEQKLIEKRLEKFSERDSMERDLRSDPEYIETRKELSRISRLLAIENARYYINEKMAKGEFINIIVIEKEKQRVMEHPLMKNISARISFIERMIKAKENGLL